MERPGVRKHSSMCGGEDDVLMLPLQECLNPPTKDKNMYGGNGAMNSDEVPPLFQAIRRNMNGLVEVLELLRQNPDCVHLRHDQDTPLHAACHAQNLPALAELLLMGAQVEGLDGQGDTALHVAVREGWHKGVEELLRHGASPNTKCQPPPKCKQFPIETPFHAAVRRGDNVSTALILQYRPDFCLKDNEHCSVLHLAVQTHSIKLLRRLLQEKGSSFIFASVDVRGNTVLHTALSRKCTDDEHILEIIKDLVDLGLSLNLCNQMGETPIFLALRLSLSRVVNWLLSKGADPLRVNFHEQTVLHVACEAGSATPLRHLLNVYHLGHLLFTADSDGHEPFHMAVFSGSLECCEILLNHGDHLTFRDRAGRTRFSYVLEYLPNAAQLLNNVFDSRTCLVNEPADNPDFNIAFDYSVLVAKDGRESSVIPELAKSSLRELLLHPLVESFLFFKLWIITFIRVCNIGFLFLLMVLHTSFLIVLFRQNALFNYYPKILVKYHALHILLFVITATPSLLKILIRPRKYILRLVTIFELITLAGVLCSFLSHYTVLEHQVHGNAREYNASAKEVSEFNRYTGAAVTFFGWMLLLILVGTMNPFGIYYFVFKNALKKVFSVFISLLCLFVACVGSFYMLLPHPFAGDAQETRKEVILVSTLILVLSFLLGVVGITVFSLLGRNFTDLYRQAELRLLVERASDLEDYQHLNRLFCGCQCPERFLCRFLTRIANVPEVKMIFPNANSNPFSVKRFMASGAFRKVMEFSSCAMRGAKFSKMESERWTRHYNSDSSNANARLVALQTQLELLSAHLQYLSQSTEAKHRLVHQQLSRLRTEIQESREEKEEEEVVTNPDTLPHMSTMRSLKRELLSRGSYQLSNEAQTSFIDSATSPIAIFRESLLATHPPVARDYEELSFYC